MGAPTPPSRPQSEWLKQQVQVGIDQIARGEFIEEEEMDARFERLLRRDGQEQSNRR